MRKSHCRTKHCSASISSIEGRIATDGLHESEVAKLKHAFDLWNSHVFLVSPQEDLGKALTLLSGTFHEIRHRLKFVDCLQVTELLARKKDYHDLEKELGIL